MDRFDRAKKWMNDIEAWFNPLFPTASQTTRSPSGSQSTWTPFGSQSSKTSNESLQAQPKNVRPKRQRCSQVSDIRREMFDPTWMPRIWEEDDLIGLRRVQENGAQSTRNKKRDIAAAFDEPTSTAGEDVSNTRPHVAKRQRTRSSGSSQAELITSSSTAGADNRNTRPRVTKRERARRAELLASSLKFPPSIRQVEMMERDRSLKMRGSKVIKPFLPNAHKTPAQVDPFLVSAHGERSLNPPAPCTRPHPPRFYDNTSTARLSTHGGKDHVATEGNWLEKWFSTLPSSRVPPTVVHVTKKMKNLKVGGQMSGECCGPRWAL
ncbi:MAG: hypothetical protein Q9200_004494 [Gallowayella weberi]